MIIQKTEEITLESLDAINACKEGVEKLKGKLTNQVNEAYKVKDEKDEDKRITGIHSDFSWLLS